MPNATQHTGKRTANGNSKEAGKVRFPDRNTDGSDSDLEMVVGQLHAFHLDRVVSFEYDDKTNGVYHKVRGVLREANHDGEGTEVWLTGLECTSGDKELFSLSPDHPVYVEGS